MIGALAATLAAVLAGVLSAPSPPSASVFVAPGGNDKNRGTASSPVATFGRAYKLARPGAIVEVAAGAYGYQRLGRDNSKRSAKAVTFRPARGAAVKLTTLDFGQDQFGVLGPQHVAVRDMTIDYLRAWAGSRDLRWERINGKHFDVFDAQNVVIRGGDYGPCQAPRDDLSCVSRIAGRASRITIDGASIHGVTSTDLETYHVDGLFIRGGRDIVVRNSKFWGNMITNIRVQDQDCCKNANLLIENNWFAPPLQGDGISPRADAIDIDNDMDRLVIRNNSFAGSGVQLLGTYTRTRIVGNLLTNLGCVDSVTYSRNVFVPFSRGIGRRACGPTDRRVSTLGYVNGPGLDLRLRPQSAAFAAGDPEDCAATDIQRRPRLQGLKCDAGAYELQEAWVCTRAESGAKRGRPKTVRVPLAEVRARLKRGDTIGRCGSR